VQTYGNFSYQEKVYTEKSSSVMIGKVLNKNFPAFNLTGEFWNKRTNALFKR